MFAAALAQMKENIQLYVCISEIRLWQGIWNHVSYWRYWLQPLDNWLVFGSVAECMCFYIAGVYRVVCEQDSVYSGCVLWMSVKLEYVLVTTLLILFFYLAEELSFDILYFMFELNFIFCSLRVDIS